MIQEQIHKSIAHKKIPFQEFRVQYRKKQQNKKTKEELEKDYAQLLIKAKAAKAYNERYHMIDIVMYSKYYCIKDCITLMDRMEEFNNDLG